MQVYGPEECEHLIRETEWYGRPGKTLVFGLPNTNGDPRSYTREILTPTGRREIYQHREDLVYNAARNITWPGIEALLKNLKVLLPAAVPELPWNGTCYGHNRIVLWGRPTQIPRVVTYYVIPHEIGHALWYAAGEGTKEPIGDHYLTLRGYPKERQLIHHGREKDPKVNAYIPTVEMVWKVNNDETSWAGSWGEWIAEDFRFLFGGGTQDWDLPIPEPDDRIREFFLSEVLAAYQHFYKLDEEAPLNA